jgi:anti-sigma B factor antagonist
MEPDSTQSRRGEPTAAVVDVELHPPSAPGFAAIVRLVGEHDLATSTSFRDALERINGNVLVDLSECSFIDSSVIGVLVGDHRARIKEGQRLELLAPREGTVARTLDVSGVPGLIPVRTAPHPGP